MYRSNLLLLAESVVRDADTNSVSVFGIMDSIVAAGFPLFIQRAAILLLLERVAEDSATADFVVKVTLGDHELATVKATVEFLDKLLNRTIVRINGFVVPSEGTLRVDLYRDSEVLATFRSLVFRASDSQGQLFLQSPMTRS